MPAPLLTDHAKAGCTAIDVAELVVAGRRELLLPRRRDGDRAGADLDRRQRLVDHDRHAAGGDIVARVGDGDLERVGTRFRKTSP